MTRMWLLILGAFAAVGFATVVLIAIPQILLREVRPPEAVLAYDSIQLAGRRSYIANGCIYCHTQQVRDPSFTSDVARGWGRRATVPSDYVFDRPHLLGTMRTGPDLMNVGGRLPDVDWHLIHLYDPRAINAWSTMPAFKFLFVEKEQSRVLRDDHVVPIRGDRAPHGKVVVAKPEALALTRYLLSLKREHPILTEDAPQHEMR